jgi:hypothetical protein
VYTKFGSLVQPGVDEAVEEFDDVVFGELFQVCGVVISCSTC